MSATIEMLLEDIKQAEAALKEAEANNQPTAEGELRQTLSELRARFNLASQALNEGKGIIKG